MKVFTNQGTEFQTEFDLEDVGEKRWSLLAPENVDAEQIDWPTPEQCSTAAGVALDYFDAGDHPNRAEAILREIDN